MSKQFSRVGPGGASAIRVIEVRKTDRWQIETNVGVRRIYQYPRTAEALEKELDQLADLPPTLWAPDHVEHFDGCLEASMRQWQRERRTADGKKLPRGVQKGRERAMAEMRWRAAWSYRFIWLELGKRKDDLHPAVAALIASVGKARLQREKIDGELRPYWSRRVERAVYLVAWLLSEEFSRNQDLAARWSAAKLGHLPLQPGGVLKVGKFFQTLVSPMLPRVDDTLRRHPEMLDPSHNAYLRTLFGNV